MDREIERRLNDFFVTTFNKILAWEEKALLHSGIQGLSVKELHLIDAVNRLEGTEENIMSKISAKIDISVGALTTAVNTLVKKGYLVRSSREGDRRIVVIRLTEKGREAEKTHRAFHEEMIRQVGRELSDEQLQGLADALDRLTGFFQKAANK